MRKLLIGFVLSLALSVASIATADIYDNELAVLNQYNLDTYTEYFNAISMTSMAETECLILPRLDLLNFVSLANADISTATDKLRDAQTFYNLAEAFLFQSREEGLSPQDQAKCIAKFNEWKNSCDTALDDAISAINSARSIIGTVIAQF